MFNVMLALSFSSSPRHHPSAGSTVFADRPPSNFAVLNQDTSTSGAGTRLVALSRSSWRTTSTRSRSRNSQQQLVLRTAAAVQIDRDVVVIGLLFLEKSGGTNETAFQNRGNVVSGPALSGVTGHNDNVKNGHI
ncbi:hypothetical protein LXA43DRAFT_1064383 [Ganoderma leucocontextum]|nr:hypothetical protein LXA43DRAFT_1064383 [Ganoderma leucocontextum]